MPKPVDFPKISESARNLGEPRTLHPEIQVASEEAGSLGVDGFSPKRLRSKPLDPRNLEVNAIDSSKNIMTISEWPENALQSQTVKFDGNSFFDMAITNRSAGEQKEEPGQKAVLKSLAARIKLQYHLYYPTHPASIKLTRLLRKLTTDPEIKVYIYRDTALKHKSGDSPNAFALPTKEIAVSDSLLRRFESEEGVLALLQHELTHVMGHHGESMYVRQRFGATFETIFQARKYEAAADLSMLLALDEKDINAIGVFECFDILSFLANERRKEEEKEQGDESRLRSIDMIHGGTSQRRKEYLREILRYYDLRNISDTKVSYDWNQLLAASSSQTSLSGQISPEALEPEEFWNILRTSAANTEDERILIARFIDKRLPELSDETKNALAVYIQNEFCSENPSSKSHFSIPVFKEIMNSEAFDRLGLSLLSSDLVALGTSLFNEAFQNNRPDQAKLCRQLLHQHQAKHSDEFHYFASQLDTALVIAYLKISLPENPDKWKNAFQPDALTRLLDQTGAGLINAGQVAKSLLETKPEIPGPFDELIGFATHLFDRLDSFRSNKKSYSAVFDALNAICSVLLARNKQIIGSKGSSRLTEHEWTLYSLEYFSDLVIMRTTHEETYALYSASPLYNTVKELHADVASKTIDHKTLLKDLAHFAKSIANRFERSDRVTSLCYNLNDLHFRIMPRYDPEPTYHDDWDFSNPPWEVAAKKLSPDYQAGYLLFASEDSARRLDGCRLYYLLYCQEIGDKHELLQHLDQDFGLKDDASVDFFKTLSDYANQVLEKKDEWGLLENTWRISAADRLRQRDACAIVKMENLTELSQLEPEEILKRGVKMMAEWPAVWVKINSDDYEQLWHTISEKVVQHLEQHPDFPKSVEQSEQLLCMTLFTQGSWASPTAASALFGDMISKSKGFDEAFDLMEKYNFLPLPTIKQGYAILQERAVERSQIKRLRNYIDNRLNSTEAGETLVAAETGATLSGWLTEKDRLPVFINLLETNQSDSDLKSSLLNIWWKRLPDEPEEDRLNRDLSRMAHYAWMGERENNREKLLKSIQSAKVHPSNVLRRSYISFEELYEGLFRLDSITKYLLLHQLAVDDEKAVFRSAKSRTEIIQSLMDYYLIKNGNAISKSPVSQAVVQALSTVPSPQDLFYFAGPFLARLALQLPEDPASTLYPLKVLTEERMNALGTLLSGLEPASIPAALVKARIRSLVTNVIPNYSLDRSNKLTIDWPKRFVGAHLENYLLTDRLAYLANQAEIFRGKMPLIDLEIKSAESVGSLGIRWLQLHGLYGDLSVEERKKINQSFDRAEGQEKIAADRVLEREAQHSQKLRLLFENIATEGERIGGGSIVSVFRITDKNGRQWAVSVKNPNAEFRASDFRNFAKDIMASISNSLPNNPMIQLAHSLLDDAYTWTCHEINDPNYIAKNQQFTVQHDYRSSQPHFELRSSDWKVKIPAICDTGTDWIRWEEYVEGKTIARCAVGPPGITTDLNRKVTDGGKEVEAPVVSQQDAQQIASAIVQNFAYQLLQGGLVHSNITPGNFMLTNKRELVILDRKNLLELSTEERENFLMPMASAVMSGEKDFKTILRAFLSSILPQGTDIPALMKELEELLNQNGSNESVETAISKSLAHLKKHGIHIPLKWLLIIQNFLGCNRICEWAKGENKDSDFNFLKALTYSS